jgi:class 3 adenylate cyclase
MELDPETLGLVDIINLQNTLHEVAKRRFERDLALGFSEVVGAAAYFARFGDQAGRALLQQHLDLLDEALKPNQGRVVDTAGDGAFIVFPGPTQAARACAALQARTSEVNQQRQREHQLVVRQGVHWGPVLTDGSLVSGDSVNLCARINSTSQAGEIRLSRAAFQQLDKSLKIKCHGLPKLTLKGIPEPVEVVRLEWLDLSRFPVQVRVKESGEVIPLPPQDTIAFGRLREQNGMQANDVVLQVPDKLATQQISRWHFELRRKPDGFVLRSVTDQLTDVDGVPIARGQEVRLAPRSVVVVARVVTLEFMPAYSIGGGDDDDGESTMTIMPR